MRIVNIAIIAHVDHGKTTLTDALLRQNGEGAEGVSMDSYALEKERGITIYSKNTSLFYRGVKINVVDTPGHADFGSEVERVLRSVDTVLLVVDAQEGPMPQTRFVLKKSLELGLKPIVVINKADKPAADPQKTEELVLELFLELNADEEQANFPTVYAIGRDGVAKKNLADEWKDLSPILDAVLERVKPPEEKGNTPLFQAFNLGYDNFLGRLAVGRIYGADLESGRNVFIKNPRKGDRTGKITKIFTFKGLRKMETDIASVGDIVMLAGLPDIDIGETVTPDADAPALPAIAVDEPTIVLDLLVNNSPFAGREGKFVTSRQIRERLERELEVNVGLRVDFSKGDSFAVFGRGELHVSILFENMRREGYEFQVSEPQAVTREENGIKVEPYEEVLADIPSEYQGTVIKKLGNRGFVIGEMKTHGNSVRVIFSGPTRGLLGYRNQFVVDTKGQGILSSHFLGFREYFGDIKKRNVGSMISMASGKASAFSLWNLEERGVLYIGPNAEVYEGMVIGNTSKGDEMTVNPTKGKQLNNMRASGSDEAIDITPAYTLNIERGLEIMAPDEYLEITPKGIRLRKKYLTENERAIAQRV